ncbi:hypothetical protein [Acinetobacter sp. ANC 5502]
MKISNFIRDLYDQQRKVNSLLKDFADDKIRNLLEDHPAWHYVSRLKQIESFALKVETGRGLDKSLNLEDFFGCTIVVENYDAIKTALALIADTFEIVSQRPENIANTLKSPESFIFDELRLYCKIDNSKIRSELEYSDLLFEIQIKTFLQHAWGIATHDLIYKGEKLHWGMARIAYQVKAMLEHAELSIKQANNLISCDELNKNYKEIDQLNEILLIVKDHWTSDQLPKDLKRLAENFKKLLKVIEYDLLKFRDLLDKNKPKTGHPKNLTPYAATIQYLFNANDQKFINYLKKSGNSSKLRVYIDPSIEIPSSYTSIAFNNAIKPKP